MGWLLLSCGITVNVSGVVIIKLGQQLGQPLLGLAGYLAYFIGFLIISLSFKYLEVSLIYALWSGVGSLLVLSCGVVLFQEALSSSKVLFFALIMIGVVGISFAPYLDNAGPNVVQKLIRMLDGKVPRFGRYLVGLSLLSFVFLGTPSKVDTARAEESSFILGSLTATIVMSLVLTFFLVLLQINLSLVISLLASAALWLTVMVIVLPNK